MSTKPFIPSQPGQLTDSIVLELRRTTRAGTAKRARYYAEKYNVSINVISNAVRGRSFTHLNISEPPVVQDVRKLDKKKEAQALARQRVPFKEIARRLNVSKASLHNWCTDIVKTRPDPERDAKREKAREMSRSGVPLEAIAKTLKISKNTAVTWCRDIVGERPEVKARVTPAQVAEIKRLYIDELMSSLQIIVKTGICRSTVGRICKGLAEQRKAKLDLIPPDEEKIAEARRLYLEGHTYQQVMEKLQVSRNLVISWCKGLAKERNKAKAKQHRKRMGKINEPGVSAEHPYSDYYYFFYQSTSRGRPTVRLVHKETGERVTLTLARYRMSVKEGRVLDKNERVGRLEGDSEEIDNLILVKSGEAWPHRHKKVKRTNTCQKCKIAFVPPKGKYKQKYCSNTCRGLALGEHNKGRVLPEYINECVICEEKFQTKNPRAEVCRKQECKDIIAAHDEE